VGEVINLVTARAAGEGEFTAVNDGYLFASGGQIQTGVDSRAKLVLDDGSIIRLAPVTLLANDSPQAQWKFKLENGKVWLSLVGGALILETRLGTVTLFGNSIEFDYQPGDPANPSDDTFVIQCLQGFCRFQNEQSDIQLYDLEQLVVTNNGGTVNRLKLSSAQLDEFIENNPETAGILARLKLLAPKVTGTAVVEQLPTLSFVALSPGGASPTPTPTHTPTRRFPAATSPFLTFTPTSTTGGGVSSPTTPPPTNPPGGGPPASTSTQTPRASSSGATSTPLPTATLVTPSATVPTRTPPPTKTPMPPPTDTPVPPTDTDTPVPPTDTDTPVPPTDTPIPPPTDTPVTPDDTPTPTT
jgi:hypothetical protein